MNQKRTLKIYILILVAMTLNISCKPDKDKKFWDFFTSNQQEIYHYETNQQYIFDELSKRLKDIDPNLTFELSPIHDNGIREFTISADGLKESFPSVERLISKAPHIPKWKINAFRQRVPGNEIEIVYDDSLRISYDDIYFRYNFDSDKIGIELNIRDYKDDSGFNNAVYILLDALIGEYDMETKISWIERKKLDESNADSLYKIVKLRDIVDELSRKK